MSDKSTLIPDYKEVHSGVAFPLMFGIGYLICLVLISNDK